MRNAWDETTASDLEMRLVLALILAQEGDPAAGETLVELLETSDAADPDGEVRVHALLGLSWIADQEAVPAVARFLEHKDPGLRLAAAAAPSVAELAPERIYARLETILERASRR